MEQKQLNNSFEEIISFDDEYCEEDSFKMEQSNDLPNPRISQAHKGDEISVNSDQEEQKNNNYSDDDNIIYDPKVKELNELDINNKKAILDILLDEDLITTKPNNTTDNFKEKNKTKYPNIKSHLNTFTSSVMETKEKMNTYGRTGFQINTQEGDPEYIKDIKVAAVMLKDQIIEQNKDVAKLLFNDINKKNKKKILTTKQIGAKIQKFLDKKKENLQRIEATISKEQKNQETFSPVINHRKKDGSRRNLTNFLKAQNEFQKRVAKKKQNIILEKEDKIKKLNIGKPKLDRISEEMVKKSGTNEPAYMRLYNRRNENEEKIKQVEEKIILNEKLKEQKRKQKEEELKRINPYKHVKSKLNYMNNNNNDFEFNQNNSPKQIYKPKKIKRGRSAENIKSNNYLINYYTPDNKLNLDYKIIPLNKVLFKKFNHNFEEAKKIMKKELNNEINNLKELDEQEYYKFLIIMGMVHDPKEQNDNDTIDENSPNYIEKNLVIETFNLLKIKGEKIKLEDIRNFLICIIGLQNYNLYQIYKANHEQDLKKIFPPDKYKKEEIPELILSKYNEELNSKIDKKNKKNNKYIALSKENKIIFTSEKAFLINRDFHKLAVNYRSKKKKNKLAKLTTLVKNQCPFKPEIGEKSNLLYQKYKNKIFSSQCETASVGSIAHSKKTNIDYMDLVLLMDRKKIANNQKIKEEMEQKRIKECTFQPNISNYDSNNDKAKKKDEYNNYFSNDDKKEKNIIKKIDKRKIKDKNKNIFDELYEDGIKKLKLKKDKTKDQVELEEHKKEFTFQPKIKNLDPKKIPKTYFNNDIYNEREYKIKYERLKHGRLERMVKEGNNNRYALTNELKKFIKDNKEFNYLQNHQYFETDDPFYYDSAEINNVITRFNTYIDQNKKVPHKKKKNINKSQEVRHKNKISFEENNNSIDTNNKNINNSQIINDNNFIIENKKEEKDDDEEENNKKEEIPLLIIDVNIGNGVKKKIYVFEGDTSDILAENFAKENNLDGETQNKLQNLIQKHMETLLSRIVEENQSSSEKYQNYDPIIK